MPAVFLSHATGLPTLSVDLSSQVKDFADEPLVSLPARTRCGRAAAVHRRHQRFGADDRASARALAAAGAVEGAVRFATLIDNVSSAAADRLLRADDRPDGDEGLVRVSVGSGRPPEPIAEDAAEVPERIA